MAKRKSHHTGAAEEQKTTNPIVSEQKRLVKRIKKLYRRIDRLKIRHNELAYINHLPPELLTRIFFTLQSNIQEEYGRDYYRWAAVTQVSQSWRTLASGIKRLWNVLSLTTKTFASLWVPISLERCQPFPVDVVVDFDLHGEHLGFLNTIAQHNHRMRMIRVNVTGWSNEKFRKLRYLLCWLAIEAPVLEVLALTGRDSPLKPNMTNFQFFNSFAPCLQSIHIVGLNLYLHTLPFRNITTLSLRYPQGHQGVLSLSVLFGVLRTTRLRTLKLQHALFRHDDYSQVANPTLIPIPSISDLFLNLPAHQCTRLLSHLVVPTSCSVVIRGCFLPYPGHVQTPQAFFDTTLAHFSNGPTEFIGLDVTIDIQNGLIKFGLRTQKDYQEETWTDSVSLEIGFARPNAGNWESFSFPSLLPFSNMWAVLLTVSPREQTSSVTTELISRFSTLPALEEFELPVSAVAAFSNHLYNDPESFAAVSSIIVDMGSLIEENSASPLEELERALAKCKEVSGDVIAVSLEGSPGWAAKHQLPDVLDRLREVCDLSIVEF